MPIGGFVINVIPEEASLITRRLEDLDGVEIHGVDKKGNVVAVLDCTTSEDMKRLVTHINNIDGVLSVGLTYLNAEDETEQD
jgi:nitrate reductase NapAB chaperone NapD